VLLAELTKPGEVGEILALYRLKSLSLDYKAKLKSPCFFLQVTHQLRPNFRKAGSSRKPNLQKFAVILLHQQIKPSLLLE
jgi:hypothetical protein